MVHLDLSKLSPQIANILRLRGTSLPPLLWGEHANAQGNKLLEELSDEKLFGVSQITDAELATAIRALLYLRCGWVAEALMFAMTAREDLREYICGMGERIQGHADRAKTHFQKIQDHDIFQPLCNEAADLLKNAMDKRLDRLKGIFQLHGNWEPYAFIDVFEEAREGQMSSAAEYVVRELQQAEFNLLFLFIYKQLMNVDARKWPEETQTREETRKRRPIPKRMPKRPHTPSPRSSASRQTAVSSSPPPEPAPSREVRVGCPKCKTLHTYSHSKRGEKTRCNKCNTVFTIPGGAGTSKTSNVSTVRVACPKCRTTNSVAASKRGCKVQCSKCGMAFGIPKRPAA